LSGIVFKLAAFEKLLSDYANSENSVILLQKGLRPKSRVEDEEATSAEVKLMVG
jgi:trehalose-6-phosphate synthase